MIWILDLILPRRDLGLPQPGGGGTGAVNLELGTWQLAIGKLVNLYLASSN